MDTDPFCLSGISPSMGRSIMYCRCGHESAVTDSSPETGEVSQSDRGVDKTDFHFPFSPFRLSHATRRAKRSGNGREDGDYDVEDLSPSAVVIECSHSGRIFEMELNLFIKALFLFAKILHKFCALQDRAR